MAPNTEEYKNNIHAISILIDSITINPNTDKSPPQEPIIKKLVRLHLTHKLAHEEETDLEEVLCEKLNSECLILLIEELLENIVIYNNSVTSKILKIINIVSYEQRDPSVQSILSHPKFLPLLKEFISKTLIDSHMSIVEDSDRSRHKHSH